MTEEEKKKAEEEAAQKAAQAAPSTNDDVVRLGKQSTSTTTTAPQVTTTQHGDKVVTKNEFTASPFYNPDGTPNQAAIDDYNKNYADPLRNQYNVDENGNFKDPDGKAIGQLFGFSPEEYADRERQKERLERFKQKEAGWRNALGVLTDVVTAGVGGNVYERKPDTTAKEAQAAADKSAENIRAMGQAVAKAKRGMEDAYQAARQKELQNYVKNFARKTSQTYTQQGNDVKTTTGGTKTTSTRGWWDTQAKKNGNGTYNIGGKTVSAVTPVRFSNGDGTYTDFNADTAEALSYARLYIQEASKYLNNPDMEPREKKEKLLGIFGKSQEAFDDPTYQELENALVNAGILDPVTRDINKKQPTMEQYMMLLQGGYIPTIGGVAEEANKLYRNATGHDFVQNNAAPSNAAPWLQGEGGRTPSNAAPWLNQ